MVLSAIKPTVGCGNMVTVSLVEFVEQSFFASSLIVYLPGLVKRCGKTPVVVEKAVLISPVSSLVKV
ncbi:hypothetical protein D3C72_1903760 [compost metagenome]